MLKLSKNPFVMLTQAFTSTYGQNTSQSITQKQIQHIFKPKVHFITSCRSPTPRNTIDDLFSHTTFRETRLYQILGNILDQFDALQKQPEHANYNLIVDRNTVEEIREELPTLKRMCEQLENNAVQLSNIEKTRINLQMANIRSLQENLDILTQDILCLRPKETTSATTHLNLGR